MCCPCPRLKLVCLIQGNLTAARHCEPLPWCQRAQRSLRRIENVLRRKKSYKLCKNIQQLLITRFKYCYKVCDSPFSPGTQSWLPGCRVMLMGEQLEWLSGHWGQPWPHSAVQKPKPRAHHELIRDQHPLAASSVKLHLGKVRPPGIHTLLLSFGLLQPGHDPGKLQFPNLTCVAL